MNNFSFKFKTLLLALLGILCISVNAYAGGSSKKSYSCGQAYLYPGSPTGAGKVYVGQTGTMDVPLDEPGDGSFSACNSSTTAASSAQVEGEELTTFYHFFAKTTSSTGYCFTGWYDEDGNLVSKETYCRKSIKSQKAGSSSDSYVYLKMYAAFIKRVTMSFVTPTHGSYTATNNDVAMNPYASFYVNGSVVLTATPEDGYRFLGWYTTPDNGVTKNYVAFGLTYEPTGFTSNVTIGAEFIPDNGTATYWVKGTTNVYSNFSDAIDEASSSSSKLIVVVSNGELAEGTYTIPSGVTLLVPYDNAANNAMTEPNIVHISSTSMKTTTFRKLSLAPGVVINCYGDICIGGSLASVGGGKPSSFPTGSVGMIDMSRGGTINLKSGAHLYSWGYVKGQDMDQGNNTTGCGQINAESGSHVWEYFQVGDWRGGTQSSTIYSSRNSWKFFPFQAWTIQNIEVPVTYNYGATGHCYWSIYGNDKINNVTFDAISDATAIFKITDEDSKVKKWYDPTTDRVSVEISGNSTLSAITLVALGYTISTTDYNLPLPANMRVIFKEGATSTLSNRIVMHAGAVMEVQEGATLTINSPLYLFDKDDWGKYCMGNYYYRTYASPSKHFSRGTGTSKDNLEDATLIVDGTVVTVDASKCIYASEHGANIMGNGGGSIVFPELAANTTMKQCYNPGGDVTSTSTDDVKVRQGCLHNENGKYTKPSAGVTYMNVNGRWFSAAKSSEKANHTYDFTYISSGDVYGTGGTHSTVSACYSKDKTGTEIIDKWVNIQALGSCANWWEGIEDLHLYNWTMGNAWHQFIETEQTVGEGALTVYSGSNGKLYTRDDCDIVELEAIDEFCQYTIAGVKKVLVGDKFIAVEPNEEDAAYHAVSNTSRFYLCFPGCIWKLATPFEGEEKAYVVDAKNYIWFNGEWLEVLRKEPYFYTLNESNAPVYYEYYNGDWRVAQPVASVRDGIVEREFMTLAEAFTYASSELIKAPVIKLLRDIDNQPERYSYTGANKTCHFDLNGHTVTTTGSSYCWIDAANCTFYIEDNTPEQKGKISLLYDENTARYGVNITRGHVILNSGTISAINTKEYDSSTAKSAKVGAIYVKNSSTLTVNGGYVYAQSGTATYGISGDESEFTININGGEIYACVGAGSEPRAVYTQAGTINMTGGLVKTSTYRTSSESGGTSGETITLSSQTSGKHATLNMTGGTVICTTKSPAMALYVYSSGIFEDSEPRVEVGRVYAEANIYGGTITAASASSRAQAICSYGTVNIYGGTFNAIANRNNQEAYILNIKMGTTTVYGGTFNAEATKYAEGVRLGNDAPANSGACNNGEAIIHGGTFNIRTTTGEGAYGVYVGANQKAVTTLHSVDASCYAGNYANAGKATINGGTFNVSSKTSVAYGVFVAAAVTESGATGYPTATATPQCTVNGGEFNVKAGSTSPRAVNNDAEPSNFTITGGYYSDNTNLSKYVSSPYWVIELPAADNHRPTYTHTVGEAYDVLFYPGLDSGEEPIDPYGSHLQPAGRPAVFYDEEPTKASDGTYSYEFAGWATIRNGSLKYPKGTSLPEVTDDVAYYAKYNRISLQCRAHMDARTNGGLCETENIFVTSGDAIGTLPEATKTGYTFNGWFTAASGGTQITSAEVISADVTYYAQFTQKTPTLTWNLNGGKVARAGTAAAKDATGSPSGTVAYGTTIEVPAVTKTGYGFLSWDASPVITMPEEDLTYTALWRPATITAYTVKHFKQQVDGTYPAVADETEALSGTTDMSVTPAVKHYSNYSSPDPQTIQIAAAGTSVVNYYYPRLAYTIEWDATTNGGECATEPTTVLHGATLTTIPDATKAHWTFNGWFTQPVGGVQLTSGMTVKQNYGTAYAQFTVENYTVTLHAPEEATLTPGDVTEYTYGTGATLPSVTREGCTFSGWYDNDSYTGEPVTEITTTDFGNKEYWGKWEDVASVEADGSAIAYYPSVQAALTAAEALTNPTITMLRDVTNITEEQRFDNASTSNVATLDLHGHTISGSITNSSRPNLFYLLYGSGSTTDRGTFNIVDNSTDKGGTIEVSSANANFTLAAIDCHGGTTNMTDITVRVVNSTEQSSSACRAIFVRYGRKANLTRCTIEAYGTRQVYGINDGGTTTIKGGSITATSTGYGSSCYGIYSFQNTTTISENPTVTAIGKNSVSAILLGGQAPSDAGTTYSGKMDINSGEFTTIATGSQARAIYIYGNVNTTNHKASSPELTVNGGSFSVSSSSSSVVYAIELEGKENAGNGVYSNPKATIKGGKFLVTGNGTKNAVNTSAIAANFKIQGGFFNIDGGLAKYTEPTESNNYWVLPTTPADKDEQGEAYEHKVREAYIVTFKNYDDSELQSDTIEKNGLPVYAGATPVKDLGDGNNYVFKGWATTIDGTPLAELPAVTATATYYAIFESAVIVLETGGETYYFSDTKEAFEYIRTVGEDMTLTLLDDVTFTSSHIFKPSAAATCIFDLNNHTISASVNNVIDLAGEGSTLYITDNSEDKGGTINVSGSASGMKQGIFITRGTLHLHRGTLKVNNTKAYADSEAAYGVLLKASESSHVIMDDEAVIEVESAYQAKGIYCGAATSTTSITINGGLIYAHTRTNSIAYGIQTYAKNLTVNGGTIKGVSAKSTARGIYLCGGTATINGGTIEAVSDTVGGGTNLAYAIDVIYGSSGYQGTLTIPENSTVIARAIANTDNARAVNMGGGTKNTSIAGGTFEARTKTGSGAYGVYSGGTNTQVSGGTYYVQSATQSAYGFYSYRGDVTVTGNPTVDVRTGTSSALAVYATGNIPDSPNNTYSGTLTVNGGTYYVFAGTNTAYGAYCSGVTKSISSGDYAGDYAEAGHIIINDGEFHIESATKYSWATVCLSKRASGSAEAYPSIEVNGGTFEMISEDGLNGSIAMGNTTGVKDYYMFRGGYFNTDRVMNTSTPFTQYAMSAYYTAPGKTSWPYYVFETREEDKAIVGNVYTYKVAKGYNITFKDEDGTTTIATQPQEENKVPIYEGAMPTKPASPSDPEGSSYVADGWSLTAGGAKEDPLPAVTEDATYYAHYISAAPYVSVTVDGETTYYATLQEAFNHAAVQTKASVVTVLQDITGLTSAVNYTPDATGTKVGTNCTLDLNNHLISGSADRILYISPATNATAAQATFTITDNSVEKGGTIRNSKETDATIYTIFLYGGTLIMSDVTVEAENPSTGSNAGVAGFYVRYDRALTLTNCAINVTGRKYVYGLNDGGKTTIDGGSITVTETLNGYAYAINKFQNTTTITGNPVMTVNGTDNEAAFRVRGQSPSSSGTVYKGTIIVENGTYRVRAHNSSGVARAVYVDGNVGTNTSGSKTYNRASYGTAIINGGDFDVTAGGEAYGIYLKARQTISTGTGNAAQTSTPNATVNGGTFNLHGAEGKNYAVNSIDLLTEDMRLQGGYFSHNTNLDKFTEPTVSSDYYAVETTEADKELVGEDMNYKIIKAYTVTFNNWDDTELQSGLVEANTTPVYAGETPTRPEDEDYTYEFAGWTPDVVTVTEDAIYTATFTPVSKETGFYLDIVDWLDDLLTINVSSWTGSGWPYNVNTEANVDGYDCYKTQTEATEAGSQYYRADDRTLTVPYDASPGDEITITVTNKDDEVVSKHTYIVPMNITGPTELTSAPLINIYVHGTTLTINGDITVKNVYVSANAKIVINEDVTLTADSLLLRSNVEQAAELVNNGTIDAQVLYTRIISSNSAYYQFGLPWTTKDGIQVQDIRLANGKDPRYGTTWLLRRYDESAYAENGGGSNWVALTKTDVIEGGVGYEMMSTLGYYREFLFPVTIPSPLPTSVHVDHTENGAAGPLYSGWNVLVSPLTSSYNNPQYPEAPVICWLMPYGFEQDIPATIPPSRVFAYQAASDGELTFGKENMIVAAPRRIKAVEEETRVQWIQLDIQDAKGEGDQTSVYSHPDRYNNTYQTGIDVSKQMITGPHAIVYSLQSYGAMAFAGVADEVLERGVSLTVYSPVAQELTISMRDNDWLNRLEKVYLLDNEISQSVDLLLQDYTFDAKEGTTEGRFFLYGVFKALQGTTDIQNGEASDGKQVRKLLIMDKMYIEVNGQLYDATGKQVKK